MASSKTYLHNGNCTLLKSGPAPPHPPTPTPGAWDFSKMALMGGRDGKFLLEMGERQEWGGGGGGAVGKFLVSLHSWQRGSNLPFYEDSPILLPPPSRLLFQMLSNPLSPTSLSPPTSIPTVLSVVLFLWLNGWSRHIWCIILLNDNIDLHMTSLRTLVPEGPWC